MSLKVRLAPPIVNGLLAGNARAVGVAGFLGHPIQLHSRRSTTILISQASWCHDYVSFHELLLITATALAAASAARLARSM